MGSRRMSRRLQRTARSACLYIGCALAALVLSACATLGVGTVNVAYEHADWLLQRMASHYVDLDSAQAQAVRSGFGNIHAWHRSQELPLYADLMDTAAVRMERGLRREDVVWIVRAITERWQIVSQHLARELGPVLVTLTPEQVGQMERKLADDNAKFAKTQVAVDLRKADKYRADWLVDQVT